MSPRSPLAGLSDMVHSITQSLAAVRLPTLNVRLWAEERLDHAMRCPECGHGGELDPVVRAEQADGCACTDDLCACFTGRPCEDCGHRFGLTDEDRKRLTPACFCDHPACGCAYLEAE